MTWQLSSYALLALALVVGFAWYERDRPPARVVAVVAVLAALAVVGRLAFAALPNVKPTTDLVFFAGYALGAAPGFAVGAITAIASNVFMGQGPWTAWQMVAWGGCGVGGALLARSVGRRELGRLQLALACALAGFAFGAFMDVYQWTVAARQDLATYVTIAVTSLPYNIAHAAGNVVFCLLIGPAFVRSLRRYRRRFEVTWEAVGPPRPATGQALAAAVAALAVAAALTAPGPAVAATERSGGAVQATGATAEPAAVAALTAASRRAVDYLERAQNRDGGFGSTPGQSSSQLVSGWTALGLAAAGRDPRRVARGRGRSAIAYLRRGARRLDDVGALQRTLLVLRTARISPRRFAGTNLLRRLRRAQRRDGSWEGNVAFTAFGLLALRAGGERARAPRVRRAARFLLGAQAEQGGWGVVPRSMSDVDDTGAVLQALAAAGRRRSAAVRQGVAYLRSVQGEDGGWGQLEGRDSNAQSTAWAVQGLVAARAPLGSLAADPLGYLRGLQRGDGHFSYSESSDQTPVWVTAQALLAIERKPFPLAPVRRGAERRRSRAAVASDSPGMAGGSGRDGGGAAGGDGPAGGSSAGGDGPVAEIAAGAVGVGLALAAAAGWRHRRATPVAGR